MRAQRAARSRRRGEMEVIACFLLAHIRLKPKQPHPNPLSVFEIVDRFGVNVLCLAFGSFHQQAGLAADVSTVSKTGHWTIKPNIERQHTWR